MISIIVAVDEGCGIGKDNDIPWHYKEDMKHFAQTTMNSTCIMGRKTYDSMVGRVGNAEALLKGRQSIVVSRNTDLDLVGAQLASSFPEALGMAEKESVFVIGGESLYNEALTYAKRVYITRVPDDHDCDVTLKGFVQHVMGHCVEVISRNSDDTNLKYQCYVMYYDELDQEEKATAI